MKRNLTVLCLIVCLVLSATGSIFAAQDDKKYDKQLKRLNSILKMSSYILEDEQNEKVDEWETSYKLSYSDGKLAIEFDEDTHYYSKKELTGRFTFTGKVEFKPSDINSDKIIAVNNVNNAMVSITCEKKNCMSDEYLGIDYDKNKKVKLRTERKKKTSNILINIKDAELQEEIVALLKEIVN